MHDLHRKARDFLFDALRFNLRVELLEKMLNRRIALRDGIQTINVHCYASLRFEVNQASVLVLAHGEIQTGLMQHRARSL